MPHVNEALQCPLKNSICAASFQMNGKQSLGTHPERELQFKCDKHDGAKTEAVEWMRKKKTLFQTELTHLQLFTVSERRTVKRGGQRSHVQVFQVFIDAEGG